MAELRLEKFKDVAAALKNRDLRQALYDEGGVIMDEVVLTLHGSAHRDRRVLEMRLFKRDNIRYYENQVFPATIAKTLQPFVEQGRADLPDFGFLVTMNLTADFAGIDRPRQTAEETETLLRLVRLFSEAATLAHSTRDRDEVRRAARAGLEELDDAFLKASIARRRALLAQFEKGEIAESALPGDVLTVLMRNEPKLNLPPEALRREIAFFLQAGSHSTANSMTHAMHELFVWGAARPDEGRRLLGQPLFLQRCIHESMRLHPASPVAWRRAVCPVDLHGKAQLANDEKIVIDMRAANRDPAIFGEDAEQYNPHRPIPDGVPPYGFSFGHGIHKCLGVDLAGGLIPKANTRPEEHLYGTVYLLIRTLLEHGARPDPQRPPTPDHNTERSNWGHYPILLAARR